MKRALSVELLSDEYYELLSSFDCGVQSVNLFLQELALKMNATGDIKTHIVIDEESGRLVGYFALKTSSVKIESEGYEQRVVPAVEISWIGVDKEYQSQHLGKRILAYAVNLINNIKENLLGVRLITLFAIPNVIGFYRKIGFQETSDDVEIFCNPENQGCVAMYLII